MVRNMSKKLNDIQVEFEGVPEDKEKDFNEMIHALGKLVGTEVISYYISSEYGEEEL